MNAKATEAPATEEVVLGPQTDTTVNNDVDMTVFPIYSVVVERSNNEKVVAEVPEYEVAVLKELHGEYNVTQGEHIYDDERPANAADLYEALKRKYNNLLQGDVVQRVYRNAEEVGKAAGVKAGKATRAAESVQIDNRKAATKAAKAK